MGFQFLSGFQFAEHSAFRPLSILSIPFRIPDEITTDNRPDRKSSFQFLSGFQSTTETEARFVAERNLSIPFRIPVIELRHEIRFRVFTFNSFPDSRRAMRYGG